VLTVTYVLGSYQFYVNRGRRCERDTGYKNHVSAQETDFVDL
jgi:hypothetical protein